MKDSSVREVVLNGGGVALVSAEDFERVMSHPYPWRVATYSGHQYAVAQARAGRSVGNVSMHRLIMQAPVGLTVDHIDSDGLNNTRTNLRLATTAQNGWNRRKLKAKSSAFKGVSFHKGRQNWQATIIVQKVKKHLGVFTDEVEAAHAYDEAARFYFGEFANLNFP